MYEGRIYVSTSTYAILKADYRYGEGKDGKNFQFFGVGYHEKEFVSSIIFENVNGNYELKYLRNSKAYQGSFERYISLIQKKKRFLINKKMNEIKVRFDIFSGYSGCERNFGAENPKKSQKPTSFEPFNPNTPKPPM
jgi:hypothetical protein